MINYRCRFTFKTCVAWEILNNTSVYLFGMPKKDLYPQFKKEKKEHPSLPAKTVWKIVYDHERAKKKK